MPFDRIAHASVGKANRDPVGLIDAARRQVDHLGPIGIRAQLGQANVPYHRRGYLRFAFPTRARREKFIDCIEEHCPPAVAVERRGRRR